jgi:hypothetical protein
MARIDYTPKPPLYRHDWQTEALASEVRGILDAIDAPPVDEHVLFQFQKTLHRGRMFGVDGRGQIILACRCILESKGNEGAFAEPYVSAVLSAVGSEEFAGCGLELIEAFDDEIQLVDILETMRRLEFFPLSDVQGVLSQIVRNKLRRTLRPPQPEPVRAPSKRERLAADRRAAATARLVEVERNLELGKKLLELRAATPNNREFGHLRTHRFDVDALTGAAAVRVVRLYGDRPEIYRGVRWRTLVELSSAALSEGRRRALELRIIAGDTITAARVRRARTIDLKPRTSAGGGASVTAPVTPLECKAR